MGNAWALFLALLIELGKVEFLLDHISSMFQKALDSVKKNNYPTI